MIWVGLAILFVILGIIIVLQYRIHVLERQQRSLIQFFWKSTPDYQMGEKRITELLAQGSRLDAIRMVKQQYHCSLLEAKNMVEDIERARSLRR